MLSLVLVGLSGSGKSTVARLVAPRLCLPFVDTDRCIEQETGRPVAALFADEGEEAFRQRETSVLKTVCRGRAVVATGGGAILRSENRASMREGNLVVWLDVPVSVLTRRLTDHSSGEQRPLLQGDDLWVRLDTLYQERRLLYQAASHIRCGSPDGMPRGSRRIAADLVKIYRGWLAEEGKWHDERRVP